MEVRDYRDLKVWQVSLDLAEAIYAATTDFPKAEVFGLISQLRRAAISIPSNIAEGHARDSTKEFLRFISVAMGSLAELETQLALACRLGFLEPKKFEQLTKQTDAIGRMLRGLQTSLRARLSQPPVPSP
jgi:four helix bundle protein